MKWFFIILLSVLMTAPAWAAININTATETELQTLKGIGPSKAKAIVEHREKNGLFKTTPDIKNVKGIGDGIYNSISSEINVGNKPIANTPKPATQIGTKPLAKSTP